MSELNPAKVVDEILIALGIPELKRQELERELSEGIQVQFAISMVEQMSEEEREELNSSLMGKSAEEQATILAQALGRRFTKEQREEILIEKMKELIPPFLNARIEAATPEQQAQVNILLEQLRSQQG